MQQSHKREMLGVLGGMGPLASAEFLKTIYESNILGQREQQSPQVVVYSDPTFPDRTEALLRGDYEQLLANLIEALNQLCKLDVSKIVICCITSHYLLPKLPYDLRERIISLVDIICKKILEKKKAFITLLNGNTKARNISNPYSLGIYRVLYRVT